MHLALSESCPVFEPDAGISLMRLLISVAEGRHIIMQPQPRRLRTLLSAETWNIFGEVLLKTFELSTRQRRSLVMPVDCSSCSAESLAQFCSLPTIVIVENAHSDGAFLRLAAAKLEPSLSMPLLNADHIDIRGAGGAGEIEKEVGRVLPRYARLRPDRSSPLRVIVLTDGDAKRPGKPSEKARQISEVCRDAGVQYYVLPKRAIENYIPIEALRSYTHNRRDRAPVMKTLEGLTLSQHDHYPMKHGLQAEDRDSPDYFYGEDMPLQAGMGDFIVDLIQNYSHAVTEADLRRRDHAGNLDTILEILELNL